MGGSELYTASFNPFQSSAMLKTVVYCLVLLGFLSYVSAGPLAYGICQTGCNALAVACYSAAGFTFGTVTAGAGVPAVILACNAAQGFCMAGCVAAGCAPIP